MSWFIYNKYVLNIETIFLVICFFCIIFVCDRNITKVMELTINIIDRNYEQIKEFCDFNKIKIEDYVVQCAEDDFFIRKYGDLNEKLLKPKESSKNEEVVIKKEAKPLLEVSQEKPKKKVGRPKKNVEGEPIINGELEIQEILKNSEQVLIKKEEVIDNSLQNNATRVKRTLKAK